MNPTTGRTSGSQRRAFLTADGEAFKSDHCKHCPHADRIRLRRLPKWLLFNLPDSKRFRRELHREERRLINRSHNSHRLWSWVSKRYEPGEWIA